MPLPAGTLHVAVPAPWWVLEMRVPADRREPRPHVHVDSVYVAVAEQVAAGPAAHQVAWMGAAELAGHPGVVEDTRLLAREVFARIDDLAGARPGGSAINQVMQRGQAGCLVMNAHLFGCEAPAVASLGPADGGADIVGEQDREVWQGPLLCCDSKDGPGLGVRQVKIIGVGGKGLAGGDAVQAAAFDDRLAAH